MISWQYVITDASGAASGKGRDGIDASEETRIVLMGTLGGLCSDGVPASVGGSFGGRVGRCMADLLGV